MSYTLTDKHVQSGKEKNNIFYTKSLPVVSVIRLGQEEITSNPCDGVQTPSTVEARLNARFEHHIL